MYPRMEGQNILVPIKKALFGKKFKVSGSTLFKYDTKITDIKITVAVDMTVARSDKFW